jgi:hypothetical protein
MGMEGGEWAAAQQEGEDRVLSTMTTKDACVVENVFEEVPETVADEHEQAIPAYVDNEEEEDAIISLAQQPEVVEEAASDARLMGCRGKEEVEGRADVLEVAQHCFNFPSKRERKLSEEGQQDEAKRPKSPAREGVQLAEQRGSGGEGGEEMYIERPQFRMDLTEEQIIQWADAMWDRKRDRKLSDEEQQEEAKRPKSPEREGVQLAEQHGSGGEGGEEMEIWTKEQLDQYVHAMQQEYVSVFDSARRQQHFT